MKLILLGILFIGLSSCDFFTKKMCGEPKGEMKVLMDSINNANKERFLSKPVPCYPGYYQINLITEIDPSYLDEVEQVLKKNGFIEVLVYNKNNELVRGNVGSM